VKANKIRSIGPGQKASIPVIYRIKSLTHFTTHVDNEIRIIKISRWLVLSIVWNRIGGVMVSSSEDRGIEPRSGQTIEYKIGWLVGSKSGLSE
jgi:hypothetical protein